MPRTRSPGPHLEWHGETIRISIGIPADLRRHYGKARVKIGLGTGDPKAARLASMPEIARIKTEFDRIRRGLPVAPTAGMSLEEEAAAFRDAIRKAPTTSDEEAVEHALDVRIEALRGPALNPDSPDEPVFDAGREAVASRFHGIATGTRAPIDAFKDEFFNDRQDLTAGTKLKYGAAMKLLTGWLEGEGKSAALETFSGRDAADFLMSLRHRPKATIQSIKTGLSSYWTWLRERRRVDFGTANPWDGQRVIGKQTARPTGGDDDENKRPLTDDEVKKLFVSIPNHKMPPYLPPMMKIAALSGMRLNEIAYQRVGYVRDGEFKVLKHFAKKPSSVRTIPIHSELRTLVDDLCRDKTDDDYLIDGLPDRDRMESPRRRGAPASQAFTRYRRAVGVQDGPAGRRNSSVEFHSFRRWFVNKATAALEHGATGYELWVLKDVVGHDRKADMTTGRYAGPRSIEAKRACVEAVRLPEAASEASLTPAGGVEVTRYRRRPVTKGSDQARKKTKKR